MDSKKALKNLLEMCKRAEFHEVYTSVKESNVKVNIKSAIALIVGCCNSCVAYMSSPEKISETDLFVLLQFLVTFLTDLSEVDLLSYLQSIFFILKLLVKKNCYSTIAESEEIFVPRFLPTVLEKKHSDTYQSSASLLHNLITRAGSQKEVIYKEDLLKISYTASRIFSKVKNVSGLFNVSYNCSISLSNLEVSTEDLQRYFFEVLNLVEKGEVKIHSDEEFKLCLCFFVLVLNGTLRRLRPKQAVEFYKKACGVASNTFETHHVTILTLLKVPLVLLPSNFHLSDLRQCEKALKELKDTSARQLVENKINSLLYTVIFSYYKSGSGKEWCGLSVEVQIEIFQLMLDLSEFEAQSQYSCSCKCLVGRNVIQGFSYSQYICTLIELTANFGGKTSADYHETASKLLAKFCGDVHTLRENSCEKWKSTWSSLATSLYNIGVRLYQKSNEACLVYFYILLRHYIKFEVRTGDITLKPSMISSAFTAVCGLSAKDYRKSMAFIALAIYLCPEQRNAFMPNWIKAKVSRRDLKTPESEEAQKITLASAFTKFKVELSLLMEDTALLNVQDRIDLLIYELEQYKRRWKSKMPMMAALKELCGIADVQTCVKVIVDVFGDGDLNLHEDVPKILHDVLKLYEKETSSKDNCAETNLNLAVLYFIRYKCCVNEAISQNADDMERTTSCTPPSTEPPDAIPRDPTEKCDIVSSYESLRLEKYSCIMLHLNKSLTLFSSVIVENFKPGNVEISNSKLYDLLLKISFEYRLHRHRIRVLQALQMALVLAQLDRDPSRIVESIGFIIEHCDITKNYVKCLISVADKHLGDITGINASVILTYYICKAKTYLYHDYKKAYAIFQTANELYEAQENKDELELIKCQLLMLHYKFVQMPCSYQVVDHEKSTLMTIHCANSTIYEAYNNSKIAGSYEMSILLEANTELVKLYHDLRCPREVRAYCRETVILAQKLVLPFRCAAYLMYLAHADLRSTRYDDCQVKLDGLADILCLTKRNVHVEEITQPPCGTFEKEVEAVTNEMQEMVLDLPVPNHYKKQFSPSSPTLVIQPFYLPSFVRHDATCDCFCCICVEYQELVLEKVRLDALINVKQTNPSIAKDFFLGATDLYHYYLKKYKWYKQMVSKLISSDLIPEFEREFLSAFGSNLLSYSYHLMRGKNKMEALSTTNKLIQLLLPRKIELSYLYSEALIQKLGYLTDVPDITVSSDTTLDVDSCEQSSDMPKTPEAKHNKVTLPTQWCPTLSPPKRIPKKCLKFNLSPDENSGDERTKMPSPTSKRVPKTPAPKIQIYSDDDLAIKMKTPLSNIQIFTDKKSTKKKTATANNLPMPSAVEVATPTVALPSKNDALLKSRTKLLTDRLRQSSKKPDDEPSAKSEKKKTSVRKNLMSELGGANGEQGAGQGAVRKSTRQRKLW